MGNWISNDFVIVMHNEFVFLLSRSNLKLRFRYWNLKTRARFMKRFERIGQTVDHRTEYSFGDIQFLQDIAAVSSTKQK